MAVLLLVISIFIVLRLVSKLSKVELELAAVAERLRRLEAAQSRTLTTDPHIPPVAAESPAASAVTAPTPEPVAEAIPASATMEVAAAASETLEPVFQPATASTPEQEVAAAPVVRDSLERRIGARWLLYVGVFAIIVGIAYFERLASENGWINETARVLQGAVLGLVLLEAGRRFVQRGYGFYGQVLSGGGIAVMYVAIYAAYHVAALFPLSVAFGLMAANTLLGAWIADRYHSQWLAVVAVGGGFLTPFLLPSGSGAQVPLFGYDAILVAGTALLARRRAWPRLNVVSYVCTVLTINAWATSYYRSDQYLTTELFLTLFCAVFLYILRARSLDAAATLTLERAVLWSAPVLYYFASLAVLYDHGVAFLIFVIALSLVGVTLGVRVGPRTRLVAWGAAALPLAVWSGVHGWTPWVIPGATAWMATYVLHLAGLLKSTTDRDSRQIAWPDLAVLHGNGLVTCLGLWVLIEPVRAAVGGPITGVFALVHLVLAFVVGRRREEGLHFIALSGALLAVAIGQEFDGDYAVMGWTAEGAALIFLGLVAGRTWMRGVGAVLFLGATLFYLGSLSVDPRVGQLMVFNMRALAGLAAVALAYVVALVHHRAPGGERRTEVNVGLVVGHLLLLAVTAREIVSYWQLQDVRTPFEPEAQVTIAALIAAGATIWTGLKRRAEWVRVVGALLMVAALMALLAMQMEPALRRYTVVLNARVLAGLLAAAGLAWLAIVHRRLGVHLKRLPLDIAVLTVAACLFGLSLLTSEVNAFWEVRYLRELSAPGGSELGRQMSLSIAWASYALAVIGLGLRRRSATLRYVAIVIFALTIVKVFAIDLASLDRIYRVLSIIALGIALLATSYLYQRSRADEH